MTHKQLNCIMEFLIHLPRTSLFFEEGLWVFSKASKMTVHMWQFYSKCIGLRKTSSKL